MNGATDPLCALVAEALNVPAESVSDESSSDTIGTWDSKAGMALMVLVEEAYDVTFDAGELAQLISVCAIRQLLRQKGVQA